MVFSRSIAPWSSLVFSSVFLQDGVTLFGSGSNDLISSEGIPPVGLLGAFFRPVLGVSFVILWSALRRGGFPIQLSSLLAGSLCVSLYPAKEWVLALLLLLALLPLALPWRFGLLRRPFLPLVAVAAQAGFARWPSSGAACCLQCATWSGCRAQGHSFSRPSMAKLRIFCFGSTALRGFAFSSIRSSPLMLSFRFTLSFGPFSAPFGCLPLAGLFALLLGPLRCFFASCLPRRSHRSVRILSTRLSRWFSSLWP